MFPNRQHPINTGLPYWEMGKLGMTCIVAAGIIGSATLRAGELGFATQYTMNNLDVAAVDRDGGGLRLNGQSDRVECGTWDADGEAITIAAWINFDPDSADNDARIVSKAVGPQEQDHWWMLSMAAEGGARRLRVRLKAGDSTTTLIAARGNLAPGVWTHVAASYDGAQLRLFVDGADVGSVPKTGRLAANAAAAVWIGANPPDGYAAFRGLIDDVCIYRSALTADGIAAVMKDGRVSTNRAVRRPD